jgi:hypothetical protein
MKISRASDAKVHLLPKCRHQNEKKEILSKKRRMQPNRLKENILVVREEKKRHVSRAGDQWIS